jgi:hypothetical protein
VAVEEQKKREIVKQIGALARNSQVVGTGVLDVQRLSMAFSMVLDNVEDGQPIELQSLFDYLLEQKLPEKSVIELCVVLKSREERLGVQFTPPHKVSFLGPEVIEGILEKFNARADKATTFEKPREDAPAIAAGPGWAPDKAKKGISQRTKLLATLGVCVVGLIGFYSWYFSTRAPPTIEVPVAANTAGIPCAKLIIDSAIARCFVPYTSYAKLGDDAMRARGQLTLNEVKRQGASKLYVFSAEDRKIKLVLP